MPQPLPPQTNDEIRDLQAKQREIEERLGLLEGRRLLALPRGLTQNIPAPGEGEVIVQANTNAPWYYADGEWRPFRSETAGSFPIDLRNPSLGAFFVADQLSNFTLGCWHMIPGADSTISGVILAPDGFASLAIKLFVSAFSGSGNVKLGLSSRSVGDGGAIDGTMTAETTQTVAVNTLMKEVVLPSSGGIGSSPADGAMLIVRVFRDGNDGGDTLSSELVVWGAWLVVS